MTSNALPALMHEIWCEWMKHLLGHCGQFNSDGSFTIRPEYVSRWLRQMVTEFEGLTPEEQASDRRLAERVSK